MPLPRRFRATSGFAGVIAVIACGRTTAGRPVPVLEPAAQVTTQPSDFPPEPPLPLPVEAVEFPQFYDRTLANGARVVVVPNHEQPVVSVSLTIRGGSSADPKGKPGVAAFAADLLTKGTTTRSAKEIAEAIDFVGGQLTATASDDWTSLRTTVLTDFLDTGLALLADVVTHPTFPVSELESRRTRTLSALRAESGQSDALADRYFRREVYGAHPYGQAITTASAESITRQDVVRFYERFYHPSHALIVVAGDVEPGAIVTRIEAAFAGWAGGGSRTNVSVTPPTPPPVPMKRRIVVVHKPGSVQAVFRIGHLMPPASNDDWVEIGTMRVILGGAGGWLTNVLREQKGYTYGAYAITQERLYPGSLMIRTDVRNAVADSALTEVLRLFEKLGTDPVPAGDLEAAKSALTGSFPMTVETPQQVADQVTTTLLLGRPVDYLKAFRTRVATMTAADGERVARQYLHPERLVIVVVGDAGQLLEKLRPFADVVEVYDVNGKAVNIEPAATPQSR